MKYITHRSPTIEGMAKWLNGLLEEYDNHSADLSPDLCRAVVLVWDDDEDYA